MSIPKCQRTLNREVVIQGEGLHKGKDCSVIIRPSSPNSGIMFYTNGVKIPALYAYLTKDEDSTTSLSMGKTTIVSVEHILSCLYGMFIDNATVEVYGGELPFGDGSSSLFYEAIESVGVFDQEKSARTSLVITKKAIVRDGSKRSVIITPSNTLIIDCIIDWHSKINQREVYTHGASYYSEVAYARTFAEKKHIRRLQKKGRCKNAVSGVNYIDVDTGGQQMVMEYAKHKVSDILGDIAIAYGYYIQGKITARNSGHKLHHALVEKILNGRKHTN